MTREEKKQLVDELAEKFSNTEYFYITDSSGLNVAQTNALRRLCFEKGIEYRVVKNTLITKALERLETDYSPFNEKVLTGFSAVMFSPEVGNLPAKLIKEYRKSNKVEKPLLKGASIATSLFIGEENLETLSELKSREELIGEVIMLLQSPGRRLAGAITSGGGRIAAMVKGIAEKGE
ncbi:MAG: 50S ribosomal protein L10 [Bernardetiaceae bacterium]|nr:50S ribosomal protein L10 [Bernardetiaceae bacterium]